MTKEIYIYTTVYSRDMTKVIYIKRYDNETKWQKCKSKFHKKYISAISAENVQMCTISARLSVLYVLLIYIVYCTLLKNSHVN